MNQSKQSHVAEQRLTADPRDLLEAIGSSADVASFSGSGKTSAFGNVWDLNSLRDVMLRYRQGLLIPIECPAIQQAYGNAARGELRELIALDRKLSAEPLLDRSAVVSRHLGLQQLKKLRPLRDHRLLRRYREAVESGDAHGWHLIVYAIILSTYSLPLRQGLVSYAQQTFRGLVFSASMSPPLEVATAEALIEECFEGLPAELNAVLASGGQDRLRLV